MDNGNTESPDDQVEYVTTISPEHEQITTTVRSNVDTTAKPVDEYDDLDETDEESTSKSYWPGKRSVRTNRRNNFSELHRIFFFCVCA